VKNALKRLREPRLGLFPVRQKNAFDVIVFVKFVENFVMEPNRVEHPHGSILVHGYIFAIRE
jgi:hypothetical protein